MKKLVSAPYLLWMAIFIIVPLIMVAYFALTDTNGAFTLDNLAAVSQYSNIFIRSIWLAAVATVICLIIAYPLALILANTDKSYQSTVLMIVMLPMWMNFLLRTYAWMTLLGNNGLINSFFGLFGLGPFKMLNTSGAVVLGMVYNFLPFMVLPIYNVLIKIDRNVINAARDLGAYSVQTFWKVIFPLSIPGVISGITMVFVPALTTFVISDLLGGGKILLIGNVIEQSFKQNSNWHVGSGLSLVLMVFIIASMALVAKYDKEEGGSAF